IVNNQIKFPRFGRISESSNKYLNALVSHITGADTDIIMTANAGEHALSMSLAESLNYASGYSVEPYEFINILEKFGGLLPSLTSSLDVKGIEEAKEFAMQKGIEIFQIESRNPHFHEEKGADHIAEMMEDSLLAINNSKICNGELTKEIKNQLLLLQMKQNSNGNIQNGSSTGQMVSAMVNDSTNNQQQKHQKKKHRVMEPLKLIPIDKFAELIKEHSQSFIKL
ncbi:MAG: mannosyl-3-phosphoglycerate synthase, partial [Candidatus Nitrosocosmicus sp.]